MNIRFLHICRVKKVKNSTESLFLPGMPVPMVIAKQETVNSLPHLGF